MGRLEHRLDSQRRGIVLGLVAASAAMLTRPAFANGGDGGGGQSQSIKRKPKGKKTAGKLDKTKPILITQKNFWRLSPKGLRTLIKQIESGQDARIQGFSIKMSRNLFELALIGMDYTTELIEDMADVKGRRRRRAVLAGRIESLEFFRGLRNKSQIKSDDLSSLFLPDKNNQNTDRALKILRLWHRSPAEGTLQN